MVYLLTRVNGGGVPQSLWTCDTCEDAVGDEHHVSL
jgi:hypothetical protein